MSDTSVTLMHKFNSIFTIPTGKIEKPLNSYHRYLISTTIALSLYFTWRKIFQSMSVLITSSGLNMMSQHSDTLKNLILSILIIVKPTLKS